MARNLEVRQMPPAELDQLRLGRWLPCDRPNNGGDLLTPEPVVHSDYGDVWRSIPAPRSRRGDFLTGVHFKSGYTWRGRAEGWRPDRAPGAGPCWVRAASSHG